MEETILQELKDDITQLKNLINTYSGQITISQSTEGVSTEFDNYSLNLMVQQNEILSKISTLEQDLQNFNFTNLNTNLDYIYEKVQTISTETATLNNFYLTYIERFFDNLRHIGTNIHSLEKLYFEHRENNTTTILEEDEDPFYITPTPYEQINIDDTTFITTDEHTLAINDLFKYTTIKFMLCGFHAKADTTGSIRLIFNFDELGTNVNAVIKTIVNDVVVNTTSFTDQLQVDFTTNNLTFAEGNALRIEINNLTAVNYAILNNVKVIVSGTNTIITSKPKYLMVDNYSGEYILRYRNSPIEPYTFETFCAFPFNGQSSRKYVLPVATMDAAFMYDCYQEKLRWPNKILVSNTSKVYNYKMPEITSFWSNLSVKMLNMGSGHGNKNNNSGRIVGSGTFDSMYFVCISVETDESSTFFNNFLYKNCANAVNIKPTKAHNKNCLCRVVGTDLAGYNYLLNGSSSTCHKLPLGFGVNTTAFYTDYEGNRIAVFFKENDKMIRCDIDCSNTTAVLLNKMVIGTHDEIHLIDRGYFYVHNNEIHLCTKKMLVSDPIRL